MNMLYVYSGFGDQLFFSFGDIKNSQEQIPRQIPLSSFCHEETENQKP